MLQTQLFSRLSGFLFCLLKFIITFLNNLYIKCLCVCLDTYKAVLYVYLCAFVCIYVPAVIPYLSIKFRSRAKPMHCPPLLSNSLHIASSFRCNIYNFAPTYIHKIKKMKLLINWLKQKIPSFFILFFSIHKTIWLTFINISAIMNSGPPSKNIFEEI